MTKHLTSPACGLLCLLVLAGPAASQDVDSEALRVLEAMGAYMEGVEGFSLEVEVVYDTFSDIGQELQYGARVNATVRKPDGFRIHYDGDETEKLMNFDAGALTMYDGDTNLYARGRLAGDIDSALDQIFDKFGFSVPIADLLYSDPYAILIEDVEFGDYVGLHKVDGVECHHLAFSQETLDWQVWVEAGPRPLLRKMVLTYKDEDGHPTYSARLTGWDLESNLSDHFFEFRPPPGAREVELIAVQEEIVE